jgi:hypothetical protein
MKNSNNSRSYIACDKIVMIFIILEILKTTSMSYHIGPIPFIINEMQAPTCTNSPSFPTINPPTTDPIFPKYSHKIGTTSSMKKK